MDALSDPALHPGSRLLDPQHLAATGTPYAVLVLNQEIPHSATLFPRLWAHAAHRVCVDGGANRLHALPAALELAPPHAIVGDLDSLTDAVRQDYERQDTFVQHVPDQDSTDFMKALHYLDGARAQRAWEFVVVFGGLSGRLDHVLHTLKVLFNNKHTRILVASEENLSFVLPEGDNIVEVDHRVDGPTCGILPLAGETVLTTAGLRWNLDGQRSSFTGLMSTSNIIDDPRRISITTSLPVAWTCQLTPLPHDTS
ncbi:thiamine pyrophosphokinase [Coemansia sp. Benny D115]|nr:thiamine pyrophosphokinase [Coemansia sp. Benny D115]